ncbi:hypothetical protein SDC9_205397 [bioreactor metagenome]|uniref:Uncharacterized protein n=1 Tax=bioreactor metagenome TaxID=1076179 RepID=A0A645JDR8_9ZZZZ
MVSQYLIHRHRHVVAGLARAKQVNVAFLGKIPFARTDTEDIPLHMGYAFNPLVGIQMLQRLFGNLQNNPFALDIAVRQQDILVFYFGLHTSLLQSISASGRESY